MKVKSEPTIGMQLLTPEQLAEALARDPDRWIPIKGTGSKLAYGCGNCGAPLAIGVSIHVLNKGMKMQDGVTAFGAAIRCGGCGQINSTADRVIRYLPVDSLFLDSLADIDYRLMEPITTYNMLNRAALLRKLLLDGNLLTHQVNRLRKIQLRFTVNRPRIIPVSTNLSYLMLDDLAPATAQYQDPIDVSLKEFLRFEVMKLGTFSVSVRQLILYVCHIEGGVHAGYPNDELDIALVENSHLIRVDGMPFWAGALPAVGRVTRLALEPLEQKIIGERSHE